MHFNIFSDILKTVLNYVHKMIPKIVTPSELRKKLAAFLDLAQYQIIVIKDKESNKVILDEKEYNRLSALANQFTKEDPEGKYRPEFEKEMIKRSKKNNIDPSIHSLQDLLC